MFYVYALIGLAAFLAAGVQAADLLEDARRHQRLIRIAPILLIAPIIAVFPAAWVADIIPAGTNYWGGDNPMAAMAAWPSLTSVGHFILWRIVRAAR